MHTGLKILVSCWLGRQRMHLDEHQGFCWQLKNLLALAFFKSIEEMSYARSSSLDFNFAIFIHCGLISYAHQKNKESL